MKKRLLLFFLIFNTFIGCAQSTNNEEKVKHPDYANTLIEKVKHNILNPNQNLYLRYSDYLVSIENYFNDYERINWSNYEGINFPYIDWYDSLGFGIAIIDSTHYYDIPITDTLFIDQDITSSGIEDQLLRVIPLTDKKDVIFKISVSVQESLNQLLPLEEYYSDDDGSKAEDLETWKDYSPYQTIPDSSYYYRIPVADSISNIRKIKEELALGDTCVYYEGERSRYGNYLYKGKPTEHWIDNIIIRIQKFEYNNLIETKYILITFPEAC